LRVVLQVALLTKVAVAVAVEALEDLEQVI
jgi:hypothetical protein